MTFQHAERLCRALMSSDSGDAAVAALRQAGYWDNPDAWRPLGDNPGNLSIVANQQSDPVAALAEKLTNAVDRNVADTADPPSISRSGRSISVWTGDQLRCFLDAMADHELYALYLLAATTGMRRGEIAGLLWHNVDLEAARLTINQQIVSVQYQLIESDLKTPTSRRNIDLDPRTVAELRRHRRRQLEERMATGHRGNDGYVFTKPDGSPIHPDLISQTFERAVASSTSPASAYTTCATPTPPSCFSRTCTPKSLASAWATPASPSP